MPGGEICNYELSIAWESIWLKPADNCPSSVSLAGRVRPRPARDVRPTLYQVTQKKSGYPES
jgi:hypothetical protein